ncbi:MAG: hypothetical protein ABL996_05825 [Micropepsaceae bacterium]
MARITACELPAGALLDRYRANGAYTDCYTTTVPHRVAHARFVEAFYTTPLFKVERLLLTWFAGRPSTDAEARRLAAGEITAFAAWNVEERQDDQLLLCDFKGHTRSWLMSAPDTTAPLPATILFFGSAVVPQKPHGPMGTGFRALLGFHHVYSRALLRSAVMQLGAG